MALELSLTRVCAVLCRSLLTGFAKVLPINTMAIRANKIKKVVRLNKNFFIAYLPFFSLFFKFEIACHFEIAAINFVIVNQFQFVLPALEIPDFHADFHADNDGFGTGLQSRILAELIGQSQNKWLSVLVRSSLTDS